MSTSSACPSLSRELSSFSDTASFTLSIFLCHFASISSLAALSLMSCSSVHGVCVCVCVCVHVSVVCVCVCVCCVCGVCVCVCAFLAPYFLLALLSPSFPSSDSSYVLYTLLLLVQYFPMHNIQFHISYDTCTTLFSTSGVLYRIYNISVVLVVREFIILDVLCNSATFRVLFSPFPTVVLQPQFYLPNLHTITQLQYSHTD